MLTVILESMPEALRGSHRAAGNWGQYPANGAVRERMPYNVAEEREWDDDEYDHIVVDSAELSSVGDHTDESIATRAISISLVMGLVTVPEADGNAIAELLDATTSATVDGKWCVLSGRRESGEWRIRVPAPDVGGALALHVLHCVIPFIRQTGWNALAGVLTEAMADDAPDTEREPAGEGVASLSNERLKLLAETAAGLMSLSQQLGGEPIPHRWSQELEEALDFLADESDELRFYGGERDCVETPWCVHLVREGEAPCTE